MRSVFRLQNAFVCHGQIHRHREISVLHSSSLFQLVLATCIVSVRRCVKTAKTAKGRRYLVSAVICIVISNIDCVIHHNATRCRRSDCRIDLAWLTPNHIGSNYCYIIVIYVHQLESTNERAFLTMNKSII